jgi:hypothetical protein
MKRFAGILLWSFLFLAILLGMDQFFLRVPGTVPALKEVREFYLDFRGRLFSLVGQERKPSLESVIEQNDAPSHDRPGREENAPRYLYVDRKGDLQFADALEEIPPEYRKEAQLLGR